MRATASGTAWCSRWRWRAGARAAALCRAAGRYRFRGGSIWRSGRCRDRKVRNWASFETPNGKPMFRMKSQPDPDLTPEQRATAAKAAGVVVSMDADSRRTFAPGCATSPSDGPRVPPEGRSGLCGPVHRPNPGGGIMPTDSAPMVIALGEAYTGGDKGLPQNAVIAVQSPPILRRINQSA